MLLNAEAQQDNAGQESRNTPLFQNSMTFQPFRKDPVKQSRYEKYLSLLKQGAKGKEYYYYLIIFFLVTDYKGI